MARSRATFMTANISIDESHGWKRIHTAVSQEDRPGTEAFAGPGSKPEFRYGPADEDTSEEGPKSIYGHQPEQNIYCNLKARGGKDAAVLKEERELCARQGTVVCPKCDPEPFTELLDLVD